MYYLLIILKWILLIVGILLGVILVLLGCILFVPVRHKIEIAKKENKNSKNKIHLTFHLHWLSHIVSIKGWYEKELILEIRIFGILINLVKKTPQELVEEEKELLDFATTSKTDEKKKDITSIKEDNRKDSNLEETEDFKEFTEEKIENSINDSNEQNTESQGFYHKIKEFIAIIKKFFTNIRYTVKNIYDTIQKVVSNINYYIDLFTRDELSAGIAVIREEVLALLGHIKPKKTKGFLLFGTGDPASTGQLLAWISMFYPIYGNNIRVIPDFEQIVLEFELIIVGRLTLFKFIKSIWRIYFDKNIRKVIKLLNKEDTNGRE